MSSELCEVRPKSLKSCEGKVLCQIDRVLTGADRESVCGRCWDCGRQACVTSLFKLDAGKAPLGAL